MAQKLDIEKHMFFAKAKHKNLKGKFIHINGFQ
jgi:hypothetical protein